MNLQEIISPAILQLQTRYGPDAMHYVADHCGVPVTTVNGWTGRTTPRDAVACKVLALLDAARLCRLDDLDTGLSSNPTIRYTALLCGMGVLAESEAITLLKLAEDQDLWCTFIADALPGPVATGRLTLGSLIATYGGHYQGASRKVMQQLCALRQSYLASLPDEQATEQTFVLT